MESLGEEAMGRRTSYERWTAALSLQMVARGVLTQANIDAKVAEVRQRLADTGELELTAGEAEKLP